MPENIELSEKFTANIVWKVQDFSVTQILREIIFGECNSAEIAIFAFFGALNSVYLVINSSLQKVQNSVNSKFTASKRLKIADIDLALQEFSKSEC